MTTMARDEDIGRLVRLRREELLVGKTELAKMTGLSVQTINRIESGYEFRYSTIAKIIDALRERLNQNHSPSIETT